MRRFGSLLLIVTALLALPAAAAAKGADRNRDGLPDRWEKRYGLSLRLQQARRDPDRDGLRNADEYRAGTNPRYRDTDNDRLGDGQEVPTGHDPLDADSDGDGVLDGRENPGRVVSFADGALVIGLSDGTRVRATVTADTEIACVDPAPPSRSQPRTSAGDDVASGDKVLARTDYDPGDEEQPAPEDPPAEGCTQDDLVPGAIVHEAELRLVDGTLVARSIELLSPGSAS